MSVCVMGSWRILRAALSAAFLEAIPIETGRSGRLAALHRADVRGVHAGAGGPARHLLGLAAGGDEKVDAEAGGQRAGLAMGRLGGRAELTHVPDHRHPALV